MRYLTVYEAARLWHIDVNVLKERCACGVIAGARCQNQIWMIPMHLS
ncbi:hypothetical protein [Agathobaculum desmolans]|nr:hypothetical protein [Agathobaculum desmolans]